MYRTKELYDDWNDVKKVLHFWVDVSSLQHDIFIKERQIRYVRLGLNVWFEENGKSAFIRPVLVIKKVWWLFFCVPMTTKEKDNKYHYSLKTHQFDMPSVLLLSQARILDKKRFEKHIGVVDQEEFKIIKKLLKELLF